jgi:hypothetical protein
VPPYVTKPPHLVAVPHAAFQMFSTANDEYDHPSLSITADLKLQRRARLERKRQFLERNGAAVPLRAQRRRRSTQVRLEHAGHVGLIGKAANQCDFLDRQIALCQ